MVRYWPIGILLELIALAMCIVLAYAADRLEHYEPLRLARHVDAVSIMVTFLSAFAIAGLIIAWRRGESRVVSVLLFLLVFFCGFLLPALQPARESYIENGVRYASSFVLNGGK